MPTLPLSQTSTSTSTSTSWGAEAGVLWGEFWAQDQYASVQSKWPLWDKWVKPPAVHRAELRLVPPSPSLVQALVLVAVSFWAPAVCQERLVHWVPVVHRCPPPLAHQQRVPAPAT